MRFLGSSLAAVLAAAALAVACSSSSSGGGGDAGNDAGPLDAGHESSGCTFGCATDSGDTDAGDASSDAPTSCVQLKQQIDVFGNRARACNPNTAQPCSASTNGICCPISVSPGDPMAVNDYDHAVAVYKATCPFDCSMSMCSTNVPSNACDAPMGSMNGLCQ